MWQSETYFTAIKALVSPLRGHDLEQNCRVTSHNYAPLRSAIHVLETLQEVFTWEGDQNHRYVSLDVRNIVKYIFPFKANLNSENWTKSKGLRSGEYG
ncbi:hypothetical protein TNCV_920441 [Trichonephila clavipes]|nr:hypothetical protein TNCV_920441 [Trichonephila clavipes]